MTPIRGSAQSRDVRVCAIDSRPAPGADLTGTLLSRPTREDPASHIASATGAGAWTRYEVTAQVPADASLIRFGVFLNGGGQLEFRHPGLAPAAPSETARR